MVEVEESRDKMSATIKTDKRAEKYIVEKDRTGFIFFVFRSTKGPVPNALSGKYSSIQKAVEAFKAYERGLKESNALRQKELQEFREVRRATANAESS